MRAATITATTMPAALASANRALAGPVVCPPSNGTASTMATIARSWKISSAIDMLPVGVVVARRAASTLRTMAVLLSDTSKPVNTAVRHSTPNATTIAVTIPVVSPTWLAPPIRNTEASCRTRSRLNSMPRVNSRSITPMSADWFTKSMSLMMPIPLGPMTAPAARNPTIGTTPMRADTKAISVPATSMIASSVNSGGADAANSTYRQGYGCALPQGSSERLLRRGYHSAAMYWVSQNS